ncbi:MAG: CDP-alcohol phosphatidyltransferase family protein [Candidatus Hydrogenedentes bacterium]|nr:CDP-alcohol phosphatidyltransferase family protein [Candidatus Hydrogenedentota bacterium]
MTVQKVDCYSEGERAFMAAGQRARARVLFPLLFVLASARVKPDQLTFLSLLAGLLFCPAWFYSLPLAWTCLVLHVVLDGMDGPLARHLGIASNKGSFTDTMSDQVVITATTAAMIAANLAEPLPGLLYVTLYTAVVLFAFMRNQLNAPYSWLVRPRFYVYVWMTVEVYGLPGTLNYVLWIASGLLFVKLLSGFVRIREKL